MKAEELAKYFSRINNRTITDDVNSAVDNHKHKELEEIETFFENFEQKG